MQNDDGFYQYTNTEYDLSPLPCENTSLSDDSSSVSPSNGCHCELQYGMITRSSENNGVIALSKVNGES